VGKLRGNVSNGFWSLVIDDVVWCVGFNVDNYQQRVADSFQPVVNAARHIIITSGFTIVVVLTVMFVLHVVGWTLCRCLRLRLVVPTTRSGSLRPPRTAMYAPSTGVQTFIHHRGPIDINDYDDDDDDDVSDYDIADSSHFDSALRRHGGAVSASGAHARRCDSSADNAAVEFKYSETNV